MNLTYLGHSSFLLETGSGTRIVTDPYGAIGFAFPPVSADIVTVSHGHYDHCNVRAVGGTPVVLTAEGTFKSGGVSICALPSFHDEARGMRRGRNLIFKFQADGVTVCHLGDIGEPCSADLIEKIGHADVLLLPVGGNYTVGPVRAKEYVERISPVLVIPMHYFTEGLQVDIDGVEPFLALFEGQREIVRGGNTITFDRKSLDAFGQKIIVLERKTA